MRSFAPRFSIPLDAPRPRGARLLEGFSPKLGRRICLFDRAAFDQWLRLEADPTVLCLCERPLRLSLHPDLASLIFGFGVTTANSCCLSMTVRMNSARPRHVTSRCNALRPLTSPLRRYGSTTDSGCCQRSFPREPGWRVHWRSRYNSTYANRWPFPASSGHSQRAIHPSCAALSSNSCARVV